MELFRSEEMHLMQLMIPAEAAHLTMAALGEVGLLQFKDLNQDKPAFQRTFANQIKRCDEMARQLRFFTDELEKAGIPTSARLGEREIEFDELESRLSRMEQELTELNANSERLNRSYHELMELQLVLERAGSFFEDARAVADTSRRRSSDPYTTDSGASSSTDIGAPLLESVAPPEPKSVQLGFVTGTVAMEKLAPFERLLFRATRGNVFLRSAPIGTSQDPNTGEMLEKAVYIVFFAGERAKQKILKICEAFGANRYPFPEDVVRRQQMTAEVNTRLRELQATLEAGNRMREVVLRGLATEIEEWSSTVLKEKGIYHTLNKLSVDASRKVFVGEAWVPAIGRRRVQEALRAAASAANSPVNTIFQPMLTYQQPPTYFHTTKVTAGFQDIVSAYGMARYREANPAVFAIITFPFLFAVMFGDIGHGLLMLMFALFLVLKEKSLGKKDLGDILGMMFGGRYIILLMAVFSIYTGLIYNEFFSMVTTIFGTSKYACATDPSMTSPDEMMMHHDLCPTAFSDGLALKNPSSTYGFGIDPIWHGTRTELMFLNSVKMKMSILIGVAQMNLGIILSYTNQRYFGDRLSTICEFIPQMIFLNCLFGYLCFLILLKWVSGSTADLYHILIYMFLQPGNVDCDGACPENKMFAGQGFLQVLLLLVAFIAVPCMLLPKPLILKKRHEERMNARTASYGLISPDSYDDFPGSGRTTPTASGANGEGGDGHVRLPRSASEGTALSSGSGHGDHGEFDFSEVMVHQMIHTIEFVLGAVSNTASYLRLWALSLAHSQLSAVFYDRVLMAAIQSGSPIAIVIGFYVFACCTLGVLMVMESLSAFLHALRLHWVEEMNKHYHGDGYAWTAYVHPKKGDADVEL